jgi:hypothetical protein
MAMPQFECAYQDMHFRYVADAALKPGRQFRLGAFFSKAVLSEEVFRYPRAQRIAVLTESPIDGCYRDIAELVRRFPLIFTHQQSLLDRGGPFRLLQFGTNWLGVQDAAAAESLVQGGAGKSRLVSFVGSLQHPDVGAYRFRREIAQFATAHGDVDCFGRGIREVDRKQDAIAPYRFSIAMENAAADHYFSEKLVDCILLETIPIYFGWPSIAEHLDPRGFLRFDDRDSLAGQLARLSPELYESMLPHAIANKRVVIAKGWHSHQGLFERLTAALPAEALGHPPRVHRVPSRPERVFRRLLRRASVLN